MRALVANLILAFGLAASPALYAQSAAPAPIEIQPDAPDQYTVVKGDTLWDISGRFLQQPWRWPEVWELNRDQIKNPHLIYPGDIVFLDRKNGQVRLRLGRAVGNLAANDAGGARSDRMSPMVRAESQNTRQAIPTVSPAAIEPFINRPLIVEENALKTNPRILAGTDERVYYSKDDLIYARDLKDDKTTEWHIYRPAKPILDPDTRLPLAYEATYLGMARLLKGGETATLRIVNSTEEIGEGDRLIPATPDRIGSMAPRPPQAALQGKIISVYRGITQVGRNNVVALNLGRSAGLETGHVLSIHQAGRMVRDREADNKLVVLPNLEVGHMLIFRVFDKIAYGLVTNTSRPVQIGDAVITP
jgi:hypothetical protein